MSGLRQGSLFIPLLDIDLPVRSVRLLDGAVVIVAILDGPARLPAGTFPATVYGEDGMQIAVMVCTLETNLDVARGESAAVTTRLEVSVCEPAGS